MRRSLLAVALAAALLAGCSQRPSIEIGSLYPLDGAQGLQGAQEAGGVRLAAEWANAHGGVHGRRIRLVTAAADRAEAAPAAMARLKARGVSVVVGSHGSAISAAAAQAATSNDMLFWETGAVGDTDHEAVAGGRNFIRMAPMGANLGRGGVSFVRDQLIPKLPSRPGPLRYAAAYVDDAYGRAVGLGAVEEIHRSGQAFAGAFPYDAAHTDFTALAAQLAAARVDVLFVAAYLEDGIGLRRAVVERRVPLLASVGTSSSYCMPEFGERLGAQAVGLFASDKPDEASLRLDALQPAARRALQWAGARHRSRHHEAMTAPALSGFSNAYALFDRVLPRARGLTARAVAEAALRVKLPEGALPNGGGLDVAPPGAPDEGANRNASGVIEEWVSPGEMVVVWPPAYATHPILAVPLSP